MRLIYTLSTAKYFVGEHEGHDSEAREAEEEVWPPFKKVGNYCPYSDDPRFAVTKIVFSAAAQTMTVAGNGGQVLIFDLSEEETNVEAQVQYTLCFDRFVLDKDSVFFLNCGLVLKAICWKRHVLTV